jgi:hypothetical protein
MINSASVSLFTPAVIAACCGIKAIKAVAISAISGRVGKIACIVLKAATSSAAPNTTESSRSGSTAQPEI